MGDLDWILIGVGFILLMGGFDYRDYRRGNGYTPIKFRHPEPGPHELRPPGNPPGGPHSRWIMGGHRWPWDKRPAWMWDRWWRPEELPNERWADEIRRRFLPAADSSSDRPQA